MEKTVRFLLIDDEEFNNTLCTIALKRAFGNPDIVSFIYPEDAIGYIEAEYEKAPVATILFLDINMPLQNGWEVLDMFGELPGAIKKQFTIYMLSSSVDPQDKEKAAASPFVSGYFEKPLSKQQLLTLV